jgi:calcineurin-like phosphoesterase family protein/purple acid phosphatase-like protein
MNRHPKHSGAAASLVILLGLLGAGFTNAPTGEQTPGAAPGAAQVILADPMVKSPYLVFPGVPDQMKVLWQLSSSAVSTIEWGTSTSYSSGSAQSSEYGSDHQHAYTITGLLPATQYYYRVTTLGASHAGSLLSAPAPNAVRLRFLAYGDTRSYPTTHDRVAGAMLDAIAAFPGDQALVLTVGDGVSDGGSESAWAGEWFSPSCPNLRALTAAAPYAGCVGNHEMTSGSTLFTKYFTYPYEASRYFSFDYGPAHFTVLDQYVAYDSTSAQGRWFKSDLAGSNKPWKVVVLHEPGWSAGGGHSNNTNVQRHIQPFCERYGVAMVFAGHNHYYARAVVNGVQHVTTGGGGAPLHSPQSGQSNIVARSSSNHFCEVSIEGSGLSFRAINSQGAVLDSFSIARTTATPVAPFDATTTSGLGLVGPNPFTRITRIEYVVGRRERVRLSVVDVAGREVDLLADGVMAPGRYSAVWDGHHAGTPLPAGLYLLRWESPGSVMNRRIVLVR